MAEFRRRGFLAATAGTILGSSSVGIGQSPPASSEKRDPESEPFGYCLNTGTLREHKIPLVDKIKIAANAGYQAIEPWIDEIARYRDSGGRLLDLRNQIRDLGLTVESAIGFSHWIVDDDQARAAALENAKRDMEMLKAIGGKRIAAPPAGATDQRNLNLFRAAERYRRLLEVGREQGIVPQVELWGFSAALSRIGEVLFVAAESGHDDACVLTDVYHIYKGGSDFRGLRMIAGNSAHLVHINDYPAEPPRETISDADRVYPGDGIAPLRQIITDLLHAGFHGFLSLELFNPTYYKQDPRLVAETGLAKTRQVVRAALVSS
jgi:2-keto-myo-inositol isomerase